jgi:hypothetical protein
MIEQYLLMVVPAPPAVHAIPVGIIRSAAKKEMRNGVRLMIRDGYVFFGAGARAFDTPRSAR